MSIDATLQRTTTCTPRTVPYTALSAALSTPPGTPPHAAPHPAPHAASRPSSGSLRLTRRGRVVVVLGLLAALLAVGFTLGRVSHAPAAESSSTRVMVVQPGDTLWSIAARVEPRRDTRRVVAQLAVMNHLQGASVQVGERLTVPV